MNVRLYKLGLVGALASVLSLSFMPVLIGSTAIADVGGPGTGTTGSGPTPTQQFLSFHNGLYQQLFGHPAVVANPLYGTVEAVTDAGQFLGYTDDGDLFILVVDDFLDGEVDGEEVSPGVTATTAGVVSGSLIGQTSVEVHAIVASLEFEGTTNHVLLVLWDVDTTPDEGAWGWMYEAIGAGHSAASQGGDPCTEPIDPEGCMYLCPDLFCPDGVTEFCPMCDPALLVASCGIESGYQACKSQALADNRDKTLWLTLGLGVAWAGCALASGGLGTLVCAGGLGILAKEILDIRPDFDEDMNGCRSTRDGLYDALYDGFCAGAGQ